MKKIGLVAVGVLCAPAVFGDFSDYVDPFTGTAGTGHTHPAACVPFGMVQAGPDTGFGDWAYCPGYQFRDKSILGYSLTHLSGTGCPDYNDVQILPFTGEVRALPMRSAIDKSTEKASPGYYRVVQTEDGVETEVTAAKRAAIYRFTWRKAGKAKVLLNLPFGQAAKRTWDADVKTADGCRIAGSYMRNGWISDRRIAFAFEFDRKWSSLEELPRKTGDEPPRYVAAFDVAAGERTLVKVGLSHTDADGARGNLAADIPAWDFEAVRTAAREKWNALFARSTCEGTEDQKRNWYTALYHLYGQPNDYADADGRYSAADGKIRKSADGTYFTTLSLWDTFRAAHPWYTIATPEVVEPIIRSMLSHYATFRRLPVMSYGGKNVDCMVGNHSVPVIADAYLKGFRDFDNVLMFEAITNTLTVAHPGKPKENWDLYDKYGYFPCDIIRGESVSRCLECSYDDWCAAKYMEATGHVKEAAFFLNRAQNWKNVFDSSIGFGRGKTSTGKWREPFDPYAFGHGAENDNDFTEGNAFQYSWHVMQDVPGFVDAMGGRENFVKRLDALFTAKDQGLDTQGNTILLDISGMIGQYVHGNEPSHHVIYFYPQVGHPEKAAEKIREVFDTQYHVGPEGLCGNDDCGQMSAWYLFSAMGFYPFNPCGGEYVIGAPQVPAAQVKVGGEGEQRTFRILAKGLSKENKYVKSVTLNGKPVTDGRIRHADIVSGGVLEFEMWDGKSPARVMCLGDSITHFGYCEYYLQLFENLRHPGSAVRYVNAGYSGGTVGTGLNRLPLETDRIRPDRAFVIFGMNDVRWTDYVTNAVMSAERRQAADKALATYRADLPKLVDRILASGVRDLTLVTPTPYDEYSTVLGPRRKFVNEYGLSLAAESVRRLAAEKGLKVVDLHAVLTDACRANPEKKLCGGDSVHPGKTGHLLMASVYWRTLGYDRPVAAVTLDASGTVTRAENAEVSDVSATADALAFDYTPGALPFPDCPEYGEVKAINPDFARFNREPLVVVGLKAGDWELLVDGRKLGTFSSEILSRGVNLAELDTPNRRQAAKAMEAAYRLHDFDVLRRDVACVRGSFEKFGVGMNDRDALAKRSEERLAKLKAEKYPWYDWEKAASEKFLASVGREAEIAAEENRLYEAIAAPRPVTCRVEIRRKDAASLGLAKGETVSSELSVMTWNTEHYGCFPSDHGFLVTTFRLREKER